MKKHYDAVFFDFDFTLADAAEAIIEGFRIACSEQGLNYNGPLSVRQGIGGTLEQIYEIVVGPLPDETTYERFRARFREISHPLNGTCAVFFDDVPDAFRALTQMGAKLCIVTNKQSEFAEYPLRRDGLDGYITAVFGREKMAAPKPDPRCIWTLAEQIGVEKESVLFVGDSLYDAEAARNAGVDFAAVLTGTTTREDFSVVPSVYLAENLSDLVDYLKK